jgi:uncharacterized membrane protein (DUF373 family)
MLALLKRFEQLMAWFLSILLVAVIVLATVDLTVDLIKNVLYIAPHFLVGVDELLSLFGSFLIILLGLELLASVKSFLQDDVIHVEVVLMVAVIALARKVIILELHEPTPLTLVGVATLLLALAISYRLIMPMLRNDREPSEKE